VDSGDGPDAALGEAEADPKGVLEGGGGGVEEVGESVAAFAEDAAEDLGDGEDKLAVGDFVANGPSSPRLRRAFIASVTLALACHSKLLARKRRMVAGGAEVAALLSAIAFGDGGCR